MRQFTELLTLEKVDEEEEDDIAIQIESGKHRSHEADKKYMFDQISSMHQSMTSFSRDVESRLDQVYKGGAAEKFGFEDITKESLKGYMLPKEKDQTGKKTESERNIEKIAN